MHVQVTARTGRGVPCGWAVTNSLGLPHPEATRYLVYLADIERSPNTIRAYAYDLAHYLNFLEQKGLDLDDASNETLAMFARWLRSPANNVTPFNKDSARRSESSVNRALAAVASFYLHLGSCEPTTPGARGYERLAAAAREYKRPARTTVTHVAKGRSRARSGSRLGPRLAPETRMRPVLSDTEVQSILAAAPDLQSQLVLTFAAASGLRLGQILGLRHADVNTQNRTVTIDGTRDNENGARTKTRSIHTLPIHKETSRLYTVYMHEEYGLIESQYVFVHLKGSLKGQPLTPRYVYSLVSHIRKKTGIDEWSLHTLRHTFVTRLLEADVPLDVVSKLATHSSWRTTSEIYDHRSVESLRKVLAVHHVWSSTEEHA